MSPKPTEMMLKIKPIAELESEIIRLKKALKDSAKWIGILDGSIHSHKNTAECDLCRFLRKVDRLCESDL